MSFREIPDPKSNHRETLQAFETCCQQEVRVGIAVIESDRLLSGRFDKANADSVTFEVKDEEDFDFSLLSTCMVSYFSDGKAHVFVSTLRSYNTIIGGDSAQLVLRLPEDITVSETRGTFRIPMENVEGFTFQLLDARDRSYSPRCVNIGPGGMKLSFDDESDPGFEESDTLRTRINYRGRSVILMAEIRYHIGHSYGIFFPKVFEKCESEASEIYRWIVNALEEEYSSGQVQTAS